MTASTSHGHPEGCMQFLNDTGCRFCDPPSRAFPPIRRSLPAVVTDCLKADTLPDEQVWDVVARWQGLKVLHEAYQHPAVFGSYCQSSRLEFSGHHQPQHWVEEIRQDPGLRPSLGHGIYPSLYRALTGYWLLREATRVAQICAYPRRSEEHRTWTEVYSLRTTGKSLLESMQMVEAHDFTFDYLLKQLDCAKVDTFAAWLGTEHFLFGNGTPEDQLRSFLYHLRISLSPADIIELSIFSYHWRHNSGEIPEWPSDRKSRHLKDWLFFGYVSPTIEGADDDDKDEDEVLGMRSN